tara:strand:+ start:1122 stop:1307 length:186 start_codon:yes stop_codon:yes gene_type:complete
MEQLVARWAHNPKVTGSSPVPATEEENLIRNDWVFLCPLGLNKVQVRSEVSELFPLQEKGY